MNRKSPHSRIRFSSAVMPVVKFVWVPWILLFCVLVVIAAVETHAPWYAVVGAAIFALSVFSMAVTTIWPLHKVDADETGLWVKHGSGTVHVPYSEIWRVKALSTWPFFRFPTVEVKTRTPTALGRAFLFMPNFTNPFSRGTLTAKWLEEKVREARGDSSQE